MNAIEVYQMYRALSLHFKGTGYDYIKYQGKVRVDAEKFQARKDRFLYEKILRKHQGKAADIEQFFVANLQDNTKVWVGNLLDPEAMAKYKAWKSYQESLSYNFVNEMNELDDNRPEGMEANGMLVTTGDHPWLLEKFYEGVISPSSLIQMNIVMKFFPFWDGMIVDDILWPDTCGRLKRLAPFVNANLEKTKKALVDIFLSTK